MQIDANRIAGGECLVEGVDADVGQEVDDHVFEAFYLRGCARSPFSPQDIPEPVDQQDYDLRTVIDFQVAIERVWVPV